MMQLLCLLVATTSALPVPSQSQQPPPGYQPPQQAYQQSPYGQPQPSYGYQQQSHYGQPMGGYGGYSPYGGGMMGGMGGMGSMMGGMDPLTLALLSQQSGSGSDSSGMDPMMLAMAMGGGMGGMGGASGMDLSALLAMSQNGIGGGDLSSLMMGSPASLMASLIGGEGARDPSKGLQNMLDLGTGLGGIDDTEDLDGDGEPDHLVETRNKIDDYLAKQWLLGKRKLTVSVNYGNMPLEYQYLNQYHGFPNPLVGTP